MPVVYNYNGNNPRVNGMRFLRVVSALGHDGRGCCEINCLKKKKKKLQLNLGQNATPAFQLYVKYIYFQYRATLTQNFINLSVSS